MALFGILFGSFFNIPIKRIPQEEMANESQISLFGVTHVIPYWKRRETIIAVNLGGAIIPSVLSFYLLMKTGLWLSGFLSVTVMTIVTFLAARPIKGNALL